MKLINSITKVIPVLGCILLFSSCSEDYNSIGSDIVGDPHFGLELIDGSTVKAYSRRTNPVQTNNLPVYRLGIYNDPVYGRSEANVLSQVTLETANPSFGENPVIDSVVLHIPYFSSATGTGTVSTYELDSVYGNTPIKLSVIESNFFLRDFDPESGFEEPQKYYSDQGPMFENFLGQTLYENTGFIPSNEVVTEGTENPAKLTPRLRVHLPISFFEDKILNQEGTDALLTNNNFKNHLRGFYFKVESADPEGNMFIFKIDRARISIYYSFDTPELDQEPGDEDGRSESTLDLLFNAITVNTFEYDFSPDIQQVLSAELSNAENLYLKGGPGAMTVIELFGEDMDGDGVPEELEDLRGQELLVNEANLTFHVNQNIVQGGSKEPERIFIYDLNNKKVLLDYLADSQASPNDPVNTKTNHLGRLERDAAGNGSTYRLRLTNHISNLINKDSTNVRLGLVVSQNVNVVDFRSLETEIPTGIEEVPTGSIISHEGTVLHGPLSPDMDKRLKLNIYYTEIND